VNFFIAISPFWAIVCYANTVIAHASEDAMPPKKTQVPQLDEFLSEIRQHAYEVFEERIRRNEPGDEMSDWLRAEREVKAKYGIA